MAIPANECSVVNITPAIASLGRETQARLLLAITSAILLVKSESQGKITTTRDKVRTGYLRERRCKGQEGAQQRLPDHLDKRKFAESDVDRSEREGEKRKETGHRGGVGCRWVRIDLIRVHALY